jgi:hypothetical protein
MRKPRTAVWAGAAFGMALAMTLLILIAKGTGETQIHLALRATARWSFLLFWLAYAGSALARLFGPRFRALADHGREFGLAFASAHLVHVGLLVWLYQIAVRPPLSEAAFIFFGVGLFWVYLLALLSIRRLSGLLNPVLWRVVRTVGVEYIALAFLYDFAKNPFRGGLGTLVAYLPFLTLSVAGAALRLIAATQRLREARRRGRTAEVSSPASLRL